MPYHGMYVWCSEDLEFRIICSISRILGSDSIKLVMIFERFKSAVLKPIILTGKFRCLSSTVCNLAETTTTSAKKLVDDTKLRIKKMRRESGHIPDQESRAQLEDKKAIEYMDLEVSGDEESEVEDDDTEPDEGDTVGALKEENVVWVLKKWDAVEVLEEGRDQAA